MGLPGVTVELISDNIIGTRKTVTTSRGRYYFITLPPGFYDLTLRRPGFNTELFRQIPVAVGTTTHKDVTLNLASIADTIDVTAKMSQSASLGLSASAITVVNEEEIARESSTGQVSRVLEFTPGVEIIRSGLYSFNLNTRGFSDSLNSRVQIMIDGREASVNSISSTEWGPLDAVMHDLALIELVRGPSSARYGANAFNGVLNLTTRTARNSTGGKVSFSGGELSTLRVDFVWATELGGDWYGKLIGNYGEGDGFIRSRVEQVEYAGLLREAAVPINEFESKSFGARLEKHFGGDQQTLTIEGGIYKAEGGVEVTGIGRVNLDKVDHEWGRLNFSAERFNFLAFFSNRDAPGQTLLASGVSLFQDTGQYKVEAQGNQTFAGDKVRLVAGASYKEDHVDTADNQGLQTIIRNATIENYQAVFAQVDLEIGNRAQLVLASRYDESSFYDTQLSSKVALAVSLGDEHTLRFSYSEAFQVANFMELHYKAPLAPPLDLAAIEAGFCTPFGISCGFGSPIQLLALGNEDLTLEEIRGLEFGYSGILAEKGYLTIDYYSYELKNFITDPIPTIFGTVNPTFGPYQAPAGHPTPNVLLGTLADSLGSLFSLLSNDLDGTPIFALLSYTNAGKAETWGIDVDLNYYITPRWLLELNYSWIDFELTEASIGTYEILPNAPEHKLSAGIYYKGSKYGGSIKYRWVDDFAWAEGALVGPVESYNVVNLSGYYDVDERITLGFNVSNLLNDEHYETFGGNLLGRRAIGYVKLSW